MSADVGEEVERSIFLLADAGAFFSGFHGNALWRTKKGWRSSPVTGAAVLEEGEEGGSEVGDDGMAARGGASGCGDGNGRIRNGGER